jgi:hypothetical protein
VGLTFVTTTEGSAQGRNQFQSRWNHELAIVFAGKPPTSDFTRPDCGMSEPTRADAVKPDVFPNHGGVLDAVFQMHWRCLGINRAAQNGGGTALKMLTFAAMRCVSAPRRGRRVPILGVYM